MTQRETNVTCPCCRSRLEVDVRTGKVVKWRREEELDSTGKPVLREEDWSQAAGRVDGRLSAAADKFDEGFARETSRAKDLDDLFKKASEKLADRDDDE
jgi:hypothetical protein